MVRMVRVVRLVLIEVVVMVVLILCLSRDWARLHNDGDGDLDQ